MQLTFRILILEQLTNLGLSELVLMGIVPKLFFYFESACLQFIVVYVARDLEIVRDMNCS